jgi:murein L,D-transpeptidase YcbB/YkuD
MGMTMTSTLLLRSAAIAALAVSGVGYAQAQESAFDFLRHEYQRQHSYGPSQQANLQPSAPSYGQGWNASGRDRRAWSGYAEWSPVRDNPERERPRGMPQAHVDNPDFLNYTPDRLQTKSLAKACEFKTDAAPDVAPAQDFAVACAATPAVSVSVLPQVGDALVSYYSAHPHFIWVQDGGIAPRAMAAIAALRGVDKYGLDPADYRVDVPQLPDDESARAQALLRFDFALSAKALTYVLDATRGRVDPNRISGYHDLPRKSVDLVAALDELANSNDVEAALASHYPDNRQFKALVAELARLRSEAPQAPAPAPERKSRHKHAAAKADGTAGKIQKIELALEELRWLPRNLGSTYVFLNQPAFEVTFVEGGKAKLSMRAVVGKPSAQTYFFIDHIKDVEYNPYWNVPRSIVINEMLPHLYRDPGWLSNRGYEVANERGRQIASNAVNWAAVASDKTAVDVRQPPGERNALGRLKIEFPNKHAIYMHDTPEKSLFKHDMRALSHGCVRLEHPREMAAALLGTSVEHIDKRIASKSTDKELVKRDMPVYLVYFTAWPDADGKIHYYDDVYDRDAHLKTALVKTEAARRSE